MYNLSYSSPQMAFLHFEDVMFRREMVQLRCNDNFSTSKHFNSKTLSAYDFLSMSRSFLARAWNPSGPVCILCASGKKESTSLFWRWVGGWVLGILVKKGLHGLFSSLLP